MSSLWLTVIFSGKKVVACLAAQTSATHTELQAHSELHQFADVEHAPIAVDQALQELGPESETVSKVIYSLPADWINEGDIADEYKPLLKKITTDLGLEPMGFVSTSESIISHLTAHQSHLSTTLLTLSSEQMTVTWLVNGAIYQEVSVGRSTSIAADFVEALARILTQPQTEAATSSVPHFSTSLYLASLELDQDDLSKYQQELLAVNWSEVKNFVHEPVINVLAADQVMQAIARQTAQALIRPDEPGSSEVSQTESEEPIKQTQPHQNSDADPAREEMTAEFSQEFTPWAATTVSPSLASDHHNVVPAQMLAVDGGQEEPAQTLTHSKTVKPLFTTKLQRWLYQLSHHHFIGVGVGVGLLVLFLSMVVFTATATTVAVIVSPVSKIVSKDVQITVDGSISQSDPEKLILAATKISKEVSGSKTGTSTGVSLKGESATGKIEISNKTTAEKVFEAETVIANGTTTFTLDEKVTVPAAKVESSSDGEKKTYGKATATVTAAAIGAESNLTKGTALTIASFDKTSFEAEVSETFTGGASREVRVVSKKDQQQLATELQSDLVKIAQQEFADEQSAGTYIIPTGVSTVTSTKYSAEVEEEIQSFTVDMTLSVEAYQYLAADLRPLAEAVLADSVPAGFELSSDQPQILSQPSTQAKAAKTTVLLEANISGKISSVIDVAELERTVAGQSIAAATAQLKSREGIKDVSIQVEPAVLTRFINSIPANPDRVRVTLAP